MEIYILGNKFVRLLVNTVSDPESFLKLFTNDISSPLHILNLSSYNRIRNVVSVFILY